MAKSPKKKAPNEQDDDIVFEASSFRKEHCDMCGLSSMYGKYGVKVTSKYDDKPAMICLDCYNHRHAPFMANYVRKFVDDNFPNLGKRWREMDANARAGKGFKTNEEVDG